MKCPQCDRNQRRGREGMTCNSCSYQFLFDPKKDRLSTNVNLHDALFEKIIRHANADGTYGVTANQLFSSARQFGKTSHGCCLVVVIVLIAFLVLIILGIDRPGPFLSVGLAAVFLLIGSSRLGPKGPKRKNWDRLVARWQKAGRDIPGLIASPALQNPPPDWEEKDIYDYGVSALLLCDRPETVDLLVLNQFHTQTNTLILTASGYPSYLLEKADDLLTRSPDLPVYLLHDPGSDPETMKKQSPLVIRETIDLGLAGHALSRIALLRKRFKARELPSLPLDVIPFRILSGALAYCLTHGVVLGAVLGTADGSGGGSDTDVSFG